ncbi:MAG: TIGR01459 family HAD-type hydrolase, partial [Alphaproteobacteria bacterium]
MPQSRAIVPLAGVADLTESFDLFLLDLWGTIHDGVSLLPHSSAVLHGLKRAGKQVILLSNAPRRAATVEAQLARMGLARTAYDHVVTSGEDLWLSLRERPDDFYAGLGNRAYFLGPERDLAMADGLAITLTDDPAAADFLMGIGLLEPLDTVE